MDAWYLLKKVLADLGFFKFMKDNISTTDPSDLWRKIFVTKEPLEGITMGGILSKQLKCGSMQKDLLMVGVSESLFFFSLFSLVTLSSLIKARF